MRLPYLSDKITLKNHRVGCAAIVFALQDQQYHLGNEIRPEGRQEMTLEVDVGPQYTGN